MIWLMCASAWGANWERQPYIQAVGQDEVTLMWMTDVPVGAEVQWGEGSLAQSQTLPVGAQIAELRLAGLTSNTRYEYQVSVDGEPDFVSYFETAPAPGGTEQVRIWVLGDSGKGSSGQFDVRDAMLGFVESRPPDLFLHVGDMAYNSGTELEFSQKYFEPYASIISHTPMYGAIGNHEYGNSISSAQTGPYFEAYSFPTDGRLGGVSSGTEAYYSVDYGDLHIVVLDSNNPDLEPGSAMLAWLESDLASTSAEWVIAFWHHPPYSFGTHNSDSEGILRDLRQVLIPILDAAGVDLTLTGHSHIYERSFLLDGAYDQPSSTIGILDGGDGSPAGDGAYTKSLGINANQGTVHIVAGHGGNGTGGSGGHPLMAFTEMEMGSVILDVYDNVLTLRNIRYDGAVTDQATLVKGDALIFGAPDHGTLEPGATQRVAWEAVGSVLGPVDVEWSCDKGATWRPVATGLASTGGLDWIVPPELTDLGLFRVTAASGHTDTNDELLHVLSNTEVMLLPRGSEWSYLDSGEPDPGWQSAIVSDWSSGPAPLGYGMADLGSELSETVQPSVYFRSSVSTPELAAFSLQTEYNDGIIIWVDGVEVLRGNVDDDLAQSYASTTATVPMISSYSGGALSAGTHELAVMLKQDLSDGEDLLFELEMSGRLPELVGCNDPGPIDTASHTGVDSDRVPNDTEEPEDSDSQVEEDTETDTEPQDSGVPPKETCGCGSAGGFGLAWLLGLGVLAFRRRD
ncbi:MAG: hypothetical protein ACI9VR_003864 [Cognaticolwellia sp.]|jgi:hypothetical protein